MQKLHLDELRRHAEASYPHEACGVLLGQPGASAERRVHRVVQCSNACAHSSERRYSIAPAELLRIQREARAAGQAILGFYHSHPQGPAHWSPSDLAEAHWSGCSYVIAALDHAYVSDIRSYLLLVGAEGKHFDEEPIELD